MIINSGKFSFVKSNLIEETDGFIIVYQIKPKFRLRQIEIIGSDKISNKKIKEKSELILGSLVDDVDFENAVKKIKNAYKEYWYPYAEALKSKSNSKLGIVDLSISVNEGKSFVKEVDFKGNFLIEQQI